LLPSSGFCPEDGSSRFLRNVSTYLPNYTADRIIRWVGNMSSIPEKINTHRIVGKKFERGRLLVRPSHRQ
jgi:hypothetical protein